MNATVALEIIDLALSIAKTQTAGKLQQGAALADTLLQIIQKAVQAYQNQTGQPLDPSLIKAEDVL